MQADGVIRAHAIGGAVGPTFCLEPVAMVDVDVFVFGGKDDFSPEQNHAKQA